MRIQINTGDRFNYLTVKKELPIKKLPSGQGNRVFLCVCDCGKSKEVRLVHLKNNRIKSCGCYKRHSHGDKEKEYIRKIWRAIKYRTASNYFQRQHYYDKGITVCSLWVRDFDKFYEWAKENGLKKGMHIDRINGDGNYSPDNCRVTTPKQNANNKKNTTMVVYDGELVALCIILDKLGKMSDYSGIRSRIIRGWSAQRAIDIPIKNGNYKRKSTKE